MCAAKAEAHVGGANAEAGPLGRAFSALVENGGGDADAERHATGAGAGDGYGICGADGLLGDLGKSRRGRQR